MMARTTATSRSIGPGFPGRSPFYRAGFTLVEVVLVLFVLGLTASIALVWFSSSSTESDINLATDRLVDDLTFARARATTHRQPVRVAFDIGRNEYVLLDIHRQPLTHPVDKRPYITRIGELGGGSVRLTQVDFGTSDTLSIGPRGTTRFGGSVTIENGDHAREIAVSKPSLTVTVRP